MSGQLHLEAVTRYVMPKPNNYGLSGVARAYTFSSAFRADKQQSRSHLTEFKMIEAEIAFAEVCSVNHYNLELSSLLQQKALFVLI